MKQRIIKKPITIFIDKTWDFFSDEIIDCVTEWAKMYKEPTDDIDDGEDTMWELAKYIKQTEYPLIVVKSTPVFSDSGEVNIVTIIALKEPWSFRVELRDLKTIYKMWKIKRGT